MSEYNVNYSVVKKPAQERPLTKEQADEWVKCALDKYYWMENYVYIQTDKGKQLFNPRTYQRRIIDTVDQNNYVVSIAGRQVGKTSCLGIDLLHDVVFKEDYKVGVTSYKLSNVKDYMDRIKYAYENLPFWMKPAVVEYNKQNIKFINDSSIVSQVTGESTFRGISLDRIIADELAFVKPSIAEEFFASLLPSISAAGEDASTRLNIISTPNGTEGVFPTVWFGAVNETNGFAYVEVKYDEVPGRTEQFEKDMVAKIGRDKFDQEFKNAFIGSGGTLVNSRIMESFKTIPPVFERDGTEFFVEKETLKGRKLAIACDIAEGVGEDNHCMQVLDIEAMEQVAEFANNILNQTMYSQHIIKTIDFLYECGVEEVYYTIEANGIGAGIARLLENSNATALEDAMPISEVSSTGEIKRLGFQMTVRSKMNGCGTLKDLLETNRLKINSKKLLTELKFFVKKGNTFRAESGAKDDRVMAMVLMMLMLESLTDYEDEVYETLNELSEDEELWGIMF